MAFSLSSTSGACCTTKYGAACICLAISHRKLILGLQSNSPRAIGLYVKQVGVILGQIKGRCTLRCAGRSRELTDVFTLHSPHRQYEWKGTIVLQRHFKWACRQGDRPGDRRTNTVERAFCSSCRCTERGRDRLCDRDLPGVLCDDVQLVFARRRDVKELHTPHGPIGAR